MFEHVTIVLCMVSVADGTPIHALFPGHVRSKQSNPENPLKQLHLPEGRHIPCPRQPFGQVSENPPVAGEDTTSRTEQNSTNIIEEDFVEL